MPSGSAGYRLPGNAASAVRPVLSTYTPGGKSAASPSNTVGSTASNLGSGILSLLYNAKLKTPVAIFSAGASCPRVKTLFLNFFFLMVIALCVEL